MKRQTIYGDPCRHGRIHACAECAKNYPPPINYGAADMGRRISDVMDVCAGCGQTILTTPDDPMQVLWCDTCQGGVK